MGAGGVGNNEKGYGEGGRMITGTVIFLVALLSIIFFTWMFIMAYKIGKNLDDNW